MPARDVTMIEVASAAAAGEAEAAFAMTEEAFRAFYERTARSVWGYLARLTGDPALADDLLQDTYYRFLRAGATYESDAHRRNALFTIATNLARDAHRRRRVRPVFAADAAERVAAPADVAGQVERATDVARALRALRPRERAMLWLAYAEGSTHAEIATAVGVKAASVRLLLHRARRRLAALLGRTPAKGRA